MIRGVKNRNLGKVLSEDFCTRPDAFNICRVMKRRKFDAVFDPADHFSVDKDRGLEFFATVNYAMANGVYIAEVLDDRRR